MVENFDTNLACRIRLVLTDCDGVLTDTGVYYSDKGEALKRFSIRDGMGVRLLRERAHIETGIITGELSESVRKRAEKLHIRELHLGAEDKVAVVKSICARLDIAPKDVAYIGDDVNDLPVFRVVGLTACPGDAVSVVQQHADVVLTNRGGHGAFRELCDLILVSQGISPVLPGTDDKASLTD